MQKPPKPPTPALDDPFDAESDPRPSEKITAPPPALADDEIPIDLDAEIGADLDPVDELLRSEPPAPPPPARPERPIPPPPPLPPRSVPRVNVHAPVNVVAERAPAPAPSPAPLPAPVSAPPSPVASAAPDAPAVLVVDDDASIRAMIVRALATQYTVYEAGDGLEALEMLPQLPMVRAMVCDVMMPRLDGVSLAKKMKADPKLGRVPILFLTAKDGAMDVVAGINAGARHYLVKPFKMKELLDKVASVLGTSVTMKAR